MNNADALTDTSSEEISSRVLKTPEVVLNTLKYLDDQDLEQCGQVCSLWKDVTKSIWYNKIAIIRKKIPITIVNTLADNSETLRSIIGYSDNFQYLWFHLEPFNLFVKPCCPRLLTRPTEDELLHSRVFVHETGNVQLPTEDRIEINIAMFPSVPGFNIRHFSFTFAEVLQIRREKMSYVSELLEIPEEKLKCVVGFADHGIDFQFDGNGAYIGYSLNNLIDRGIAFYGERVQAVCIRIGYNYFSVKEQLERLKYLKPKIAQEKCFAYIFLYFRWKKGVNEILEAFKAEFPYVTFVLHHYIPSFVLCNPLEIYNYDCVEVLPQRELACVVFVW